jgi:hypothetical protein
VSDATVQREIVFEIENRLNKHQEIIEILNQQIAKISKVKFSILKQAFSGKLARQEDYETLRHYFII